MQVVVRLLQSLEWILPHEVVIGLGVVVALVAAPFWYHQVKVRQIRRQVGRVAVATSVEQKRELEDKALEMAEGKPRRVVALAYEAFRINQRTLGSRAVDELVRMGKADKDVAFIRRKYLDVQVPTMGHPLEAKGAVKRLFEQGMFDLARARLDEALAKFPTDEDLRKLDKRFPKAVELAKRDQELARGKRNAAAQQPSDGNHRA